MGTCFRYSKMWYHFENFGTNSIIFLALHASELSKVVPPDIFDMVPGTIMGGTRT